MPSTTPTVFASLMARHPIVTLLIVGILARVIVWQFLGSDIFSLLPTEAWQRDCTALLADVPQALVSVHTRPSMVVIRELFKCAAWPTISPLVFDLLLTSGANIFAAAFVYLTLRLLSVGQILAVVVAAVWSVTLIAWEYYRFSAHHNHLVIALVAFVVHATIARSKNASLTNDLGFAGWSGVLLLTYGPAMILVPLLALVSSPWRSGLSATIRSGVVALSVPALVVIGVGYKNFQTVGVFSSSSFLAVNLGQFGYIALGDNREQKMPLVRDQLEGSRWWNWCYDLAVERHSGPRAGLYGLKGECLDFEDSGAIRNALSKAKLFGEPIYIKSLERDLKVAENSPWVVRLNGVGNASASEVAFSQVAKRIWRQQVLTNWRGFLRAFLLSNHNFYVVGPLMFDGVHHEPELAKGPSVINSLATILGVVLVGFVLLGCIVVIVVVGRLVLVSCRTRLRDVSNTEFDVFLISAIFLSYFVTATVMNLISCCENARQFQAMSVIPLVGGVFLIDYFLSLRRRRA